MVRQLTVDFNRVIGGDLIPSNSRRARDSQAVRRSLIHNRTFRGECARDRQFWAGVWHRD